MSCWHRQVRVGLLWCIEELAEGAVVAGVIGGGVAASAASAAFAASAASAVSGAAAGAAAGDDGPEWEVPVDPEDSRVV